MMSLNETVSMFFSSVTVITGATDGLGKAYAEGVSSKSASY